MVTQVDPVLSAPASPNDELASETHSEMKPNKRLSSLSLDPHPISTSVDSPSATTVHIIASTTSTIANTVHSPTEPPYDHFESPLSEEDIDLSLVYALHTFAATMEGQCAVVRSEPLILLDDSNSYWWLVKPLRSNTIGYIPAEIIETPYERLARVNQRKNVEGAVFRPNDIPGAPSKSTRPSLVPKTVVFLADPRGDVFEYSAAVSDDSSADEPEFDTEIETHTDTRVHEDTELTTVELAVKVADAEDVDSTKPNPRRTSLNAGRLLRKHDSWSENSISDSAIPAGVAPAPVLEIVKTSRSSPADVDHDADTATSPHPADLLAALSPLSEAPSKSHSSIMSPLSDSSAKSRSSMISPLSDSPAKSRSNVISPLSVSPVKSRNSMMSPSSETPVKSRNSMMSPSSESPAKVRDSMMSPFSETLAKSRNSMVSPLSESPAKMLSPSDSPHPAKLQLDTMSPISTSDLSISEIDPITVLRIFPGTCSIPADSQKFKTVVVTKTMSVKELLHQALLKYRVFGPLAAPMDAEHNRPSEVMADWFLTLSFSDAVKTGQHHKLNPSDNVLMSLKSIQQQDDSDSTKSPTASTPTKSERKGSLLTRFASKLYTPTLTASTDPAHHHLAKPIFHIISPQESSSIRLLLHQYSTVKKQAPASFSDADLKASLLSPNSLIRSLSSASTTLIRVEIIQAPYKLPSPKSKKGKSLPTAAVRMAKTLKVDRSSVVSNIVSAALQKFAMAEGRALGSVQDFELLDSVTGTVIPMNVTLPVTSTAKLPTFTLQRTSISNQGTTGHHSSKRPSLIESIHSSVKPPSILVSEPKRVDSGANLTSEPAPLTPSPLDSSTRFTELLTEAQSLTLNTLFEEKNQVPVPHTASH